MERASWDQPLLQGVVAGDGRRVDLRPRPGGAESGALGDEVLSAGDQIEWRRGRRSIDAAGRSAARGADRVHAQRPVGHRPRRRDPDRDRSALRHRDPAPLLQGRHARRRQLPRVHGRDQRRARARAFVLPLSGQTGWRSPPTARARSPARRWCSSCCSRTFPKRPTRSIPSSISGRGSSDVGKPRFAARHQPAAGSVASGDRGAPRRLHPVRPLRARLPRGAGERRHRLRLPRRALEDRLRPRRSDGRLHLRRLRRMRAGVSDRRADAGARRRALVVADKQVESVCPYCGVGLPAHLSRQGEHDSVRAGQGRPGELEPAVRQGPLRLRLRAAPASPHHAAHPQARGRRSTRTSPSIRTTGSDVFREASWDEALDVRCRRPARASATRTARNRSPASVRRRARTRRPTCSRSWCATGFGSNNVDHCTRLCHASSVAALMEGINSGAVSNQVRDVAKAEVIFVIGANPTINHPVAATWMKNAAKAGAKLIVADPRRTDLARHATYYLQFNADTDVALLNAMLHVIVDGGARRRGVHPRPHVGLRSAGREREGVLAGADGADLRHRRARRSARSRGCTRRRRAR